METSTQAFKPKQKAYALLMAFAFLLQPLAPAVAATGDQPYPYVVPVMDELKLRLSSKNPPAQNVPQGANDIPLASFFFEATYADLTVVNVTFTKKGASTNGVVEDLTLTKEQNGEEIVLASGLKLNNDNTVTFSNINQIIQGNSGGGTQDNIFTLKGDVSSFADKNDTFYFGIEKNEDIKVAQSHAVISGAPVYGNIMTISNDYPQWLTVIKSSTNYPATTIPAGEKVNLLKVNFNTTCNGEPLTLNAVTFTTSGTIEDNDLVDISLFDETMNREVGRSTLVNGQIMFKNPYQLRACTSHVMSLKGYFASTADDNENVAARISEKKDIKVTGNTHGYPLQVFGNFPVQGNTMTVKQEEQLSNLKVAVSYNPLSAALNWDPYFGSKSFDGYAIYIQPTTANNPATPENVHRIKKSDFTCQSTGCLYYKTGQYKQDNVYKYFQEGVMYRAMIFLYKNTDTSIEIFPYSQTDLQNEDLFEFKTQEQPKYADLYVKKITFEPNWRGGNHDAIVAEYCNQGQKATNADVKTYFYVEGQSHIHTWGGLQLQPGSCTQAYADIPSDLKFKETRKYDIFAKTDYNNTVTESREDNNDKWETVFVDAHEKKGADLVVEDLYTVETSDKSNPEIRASICNRGDQMLENADVITRFSNNTNHTSSDHRWNGLDLPAGSCKTAFAMAKSLKIADSGTYNINAYVDYEMDVKESNESNNSYSENLYVNVGAEAKSDLMIQTLMYHKQLNHKDHGNVKEILSAHICNTGNKTLNLASQNINLDTVFRNEDKNIDGTHRIYDYQGLVLNPGECSKAEESPFFYVKNLGVYQDGSYKFSAHVDSTNHVVEQNENNNKIAQTLYIDVQDAPTYPDLYISDIYYSKYTPENKYYVYGVLCNKGDKAAVTQGSKTRFYQNGAVYIDTEDVQSLAPGACANVLGDPASLNIRQTGNYQITVSADYTNIVGESNEGNNSRTETVYIVIPDSGSNPPQTGTGSTTPPAGYEDEVILASANQPNPFPDTDMNTLEGKAAAELYYRAVIGGFPDGQFKGNRMVNRAEGAKFLLLSRYGTVADRQNNGRCPDVLDGQWYTKFIVTALDFAIMQGYPDGYCRPEQGINTAEFLKMLTLTFGLETNLPYHYVDVDEEDWFAQYAGAAEKYKLFPNRTTYLNPASKLTRYEVAVAIYQYLINR